MVGGAVKTTHIGETASGVEHTVESVGTHGSDKTSKDQEAPANESEPSPQAPRKKNSV
jgi:hypothetical protein